MFKRFWWVFLVMVVIGPVIGLMLAAVVTYVMPKTYESNATIEVKPRSSNFNGDSLPQMTPQYFFGTEFEKIKSRASLVKVIEKLELTNKWGVDQETAVRILKGIVTVTYIRGTDLISIKVRHTNREDTRDIAAEVAKVYRDYRMEISNRNQERYLAELNKAVIDQEEKVEEARKVLATIARTGSFLGGRDMSEEDVKKAMDELRVPDMIDAKRDLETDQALLEKLKLKLIGAKIATNISSESIVIHEEPQIAQAPASPNVTLNLVLGTLFGLLISPLLALPIMLILHRLNPVKKGRTSADPG